MQTEILIWVLPLAEGPTSSQSTITSWESPTKSPGFASPIRLPLSTHLPELQVQKVGPNEMPLTTHTILQFE